MKLADALALARQKQREKAEQFHQANVAKRRAADRAERTAALARLGPQIRISARETRRLMKQSRDMQSDLCKLTYRLFHAPGAPMRARAPPLPSRVDLEWVSV